MPVLGKQGFYGRFNLLAAAYFFWASARTFLQAGVTEPAIVLFGYLRHGLVGRGVMLFGVVLLVLNFLDGLYKLARLDWHVAYQIVMTLCYIALSARLIQLILAFRGE